MVAQVCGLRAHEFVHTFGDAHIYANHLSQIELQVAREPRPLPQLRLSTGVRNIFDFTFEDFSIQGYDPHPPIRGSISV